MLVWKTPFFHSYSCELHWEPSMLLVTLSLLPSLKNLIQLLTFLHQATTVRKYLHFLVRFSGQRKCSNFLFITARSNRLRIHLSHFVYQFIRFVSKGLGNGILIRVVWEGLGFVNGIWIWEGYITLVRIVLAFKISRHEETFPLISEKETWIRVCYEFFRCLQSFLVYFSVWFTRKGSVWRTIYVSPSPTFLES